MNDKPIVRVLNDIKKKCSVRALQIENFFICFLGRNRHP